MISGCAGSTPAAGSMEYNVETLVEGLQHIKSMMGPCPTEEHLPCIGCRFEWQETLDVVDNLLEGKTASDHWTLDG